MAYPPSQRSPYFDWPLDGWKIGVAVLLFAGLAAWWWMGIDAPAPEEVGAPLPLTTSQAHSFGSNPYRNQAAEQPAVMVEPSSTLMMTATIPATATPLPSEIPVEIVVMTPTEVFMPTAIVSETATATATSTPTATLMPTSTETSTATSSPTVTATPSPTLLPTIAPTPSATPTATTPPLIVEVLGGAETPLTNSRSVLSGRATPGAILVIDVEDKRYFVESDPNGEWIFVSPAPLPAGTTPLRIGLLGPGGRGEREIQSYNVQIGEEAQPIPPPVLDPLPDEGLTTIPVLSGRALRGMSIRVYARRQPTDAPILLAETVTAEDGRWSAQPADPLAPGDYSVWVVLLDEEGRPVSRSAAQRMTIDESQP